MAHDIIADACNNIMNAKRARKKSAVAKIYSKFLIEILKIAKTNGYVDDFKINEKEKSLKISFDKINECGAIKPRYFADKKMIDMYVRRFLPARDFGIIIVSTNKGLMTHKEAIEKNIGGALIAYFY
ncbi:MAG: 30S ribosomal protein S8 [Nanoarchaeota archaeon]